MSKDKSGQAFPHFTRHTLIDGGIVELTLPGMTLRQWYKGQAIMGVLANQQARPFGMAFTEADAAAVASRIADALLEEDEK